MPEDGFSTSAAAAAVGVSARQVDYWHRLRLVRPSIAEGRGSGSFHRWSDEDVELLRAVGAMFGQGLGVDVCRRALPLIREASAEGCRWLVVGRTTRRGPGRMPTDVDNIAVVAEGYLEEAVRAGGGCATVVDLRASEFVDNSAKSQGYASIAAQGDAATVAS